MTIEPVFAAMLGGRELEFILFAVLIVVSAVLGSVIAVAMHRMRRKRANKQAPAATQPPPVR